VAFIRLPAISGNFFRLSGKLTLNSRMARCYQLPCLLGALGSWAVPPPSPFLLSAHGAVKRI